MSHACLFAAPFGSLISALRSFVQASVKFPAYSTAASCGSGNGAAWYSSLPTRPGAGGWPGRAAGVRGAPAVVPPTAGVAMRVALGLHCGCVRQPVEDDVVVENRQ